MENFLEGETSFHVSENYTWQVGIESHLCFQHRIYMIMRLLFSNAAQHAMYIDQNWLLWQKKNKQNKKQWSNKLYFIPMRFLFFWNTWYSPHHVRSVTWMKLVKWNTKVWMFLENKHFDQHKNEWIIKTHRPYLSTFPNTKIISIIFDMSVLRVCWTNLEVFGNVAKYNLNCLIYLFKNI